MSRKPYKKELPSVFTTPKLQLCLSTQCTIWSMLRVHAGILQVPRTQRKGKSAKTMVESLLVSVGMKKIHLPSIIRA